jgi:hypothetical protein
MTLGIQMLVFYCGCCLHEELGFHLGPLRSLAVLVKAIVCRLEREHYGVRGVRAERLALQSR